MSNLVDVAHKYSKYYKDASEAIIGNKLIILDDKIDVWCKGNIVNISYNVIRAKQYKFFEKIPNVFI